MPSNQGHDWGYPMGHVRSERARKGGGACDVGGCRAGVEGVEAGRMHLQAEVQRPVRMAWRGREMPTAPEGMRRVVGREKGSRSVAGKVFPNWCWRED